MRIIVVAIVVFVVGLGLFIVNFDNLVINSLKRNPEKLTEVLQSYHEQQKIDVEKHKIRAAAKEPVFVDTANAPKRGNPNGKYKLVVFTDFQCPYCSSAEATLKELEAKYPDEIEIAYKNLPLAFHKEAEPAARAAWAAGEQGRYFEYVEKLWQNQRNLNHDTYLSIAQELDLNIGKFRLDQESSASLQAINTDREEAKRLGFTGTPAILVNGIPVLGAYPLDYFEMVFAVLDEK